MKHKTSTRSCCENSTLFAVLAHRMCKSFTKRYMQKFHGVCDIQVPRAITGDHKNICTNTFTSFTPSWPESYTRSLGVSWSLLSLHAVRRAHQQRGARTPWGLRRSHSHTPNTVFSSTNSCSFFLVSRI